jgi:hypothetical protein
MRSPASSRARIPPVTLSGGASKDNGLHGLDIEATSSLVISGGYASTGNGVFGINVNNGSSLTLTAADLTLTTNVVGLQLGTNAACFLDGQSKLNSSGNIANGLTAVSGSHLFDFGGQITSSGNGLHGISVNSKAGFDLDAGSQVTSDENTGDGVHLEQGSVMTIFNIPQFSGVSATTTLTTNSNKANGINLLTGSRLLVSNLAAIQSTGNALAGLALDDGSSASFGATIDVDQDADTTVTGNLQHDLALTFGSRLTTFTNDTFGSVTCDATVLVRGPIAIKCPQP